MKKILFIGLLVASGMANAGLQEAFKETSLLDVVDELGLQGKSIKEGNLVSPVGESKSDNTAKVKLGFVVNDPKVKNVYVIASRNPYPLVASFDFKKVGVVQEVMLPIRMVGQSFLTTIASTSEVIDRSSLNVGISGSSCGDAGVAQVPSNNYGKTSVKATTKNGITTIDVSIKHPQFGRYLNKDRNVIDSFVLKVAEAELVSSSFGNGVSENPVITFKVKGLSVGAPVVVEWKDTQGKKVSVSTKVE